MNIKKQWHHEHVTKNGRWLSVHSDNHLQVARHERWIFPIWHMKQNKQTWLPLWHAFLQRFWSNHPVMSYHNPNTPPTKNNNWIFVEVPISHHITQNIILNWSQWSWRLGLERSVAIHLHLIRLIKSIRQTMGRWRLCRLSKCSWGLMAFLFFPHVVWKTPSQKGKKEDQLKREGLVVAFFLLGFGYD